MVFQDGASHVFGGAFDNSEINARYGTEIAGAIGYSLLKGFTLAVDYRAGLMKLEPSRE